jgi:hypothetical protein
MGAEVLRGGVVLAEAGTRPGDGQSGRLSVSSRGTAAEGNGRQEHGEVVEGAGGQVDEHRSVKAELRDAASGPSGWRRQGLNGKERQSRVVAG